MVKINMCKLWKKYLLCFAQEHVEFRFSEVKSILSLLKIETRFPENLNSIHPYWVVEFSSEDDVKRFANRSISLRYCIELWAQANDINTLHNKMKNYPKNLIEPFTSSDKSFKIDVETFCKHFTQKEKVEKLETFSYLPLEGPVDLKNPDVTFQYIEYYGIDPRNPPDDPYDIYFGRLISEGARQFIKKYSLKTRKFIGNTSMDSQLSLLMANQAKIDNGDIVLDPFVGSGSLLVAAAHFGGYVLGTDIDYLMLHARTRPSRIKQKKRDCDENIQANLKQYGLEDRYLDVLINDFATPFWKDDVVFDAIITDPPYGIREATERVGSNRENYTISEHHLPTHIPAKIDYSISNLYVDLLKFSVKHLKLGGRLVCWFPVFRDDYKEDGLPSHPCLKLVANCEQILNKTTSRRLLTFEKIESPCEDQLNSFHTQVTDFREKYYLAREETRQERRMREAKIREENRIKALQNQKE